MLLRERNAWRTERALMVPVRARKQKGALVNSQQTP